MICLIFMVGVECLRSLCIRHGALRCFYEGGKHSGSRGFTLPGFSGNRRDAFYEKERAGVKDRKEDAGDGPTVCSGTD